jgi:pimeloyl-ACP methyl ester carboxylesterase
MRSRVVALLVCWFSVAPAGHSQGVLDNDALRAALNIVRDIASQVVFSWGNAQDSRYGLSIDETWSQSAIEQPLVVIVHGYASEADEFDSFRGRLRDGGFATAVFAYPNDAAVDFSARQFAAALQHFEREYPDRQLSLVAHSMGGLVARLVIEDPDIGGPDIINQLIMVATPNHGSNLARVPVSLDVWQNWLDGEPDTVKSVFFESVLDGLNEARLDLQPESGLLERLGSLPRNPEVSYSLLLGNSGPATREQLDELRRLILGQRDTNVALRALGPRLEELLADLDELVDGLGDGAVAVERGRLEGVDDTIVFSFNHGAITSALSGASGQRLVAEIMTRLIRS